MSKKFCDLTDSQKAAHDATLAKYTIDKSATPESTNTSDHPGGLQVGHEHNYTKQVAVKDIDDLNDKVGYPSEYYHNGTADDSDIDYPAPFAQSSIAKMNPKDADFKKQLSKEEHKVLKQAMNSYLHGDSSKLQDYKDAINTTFFRKPLMMAVSSSQDITITKDHPLIVKGDHSGQPVHLIYGTVTIEDGGYIQSDVPFTISSQVFTVL
ncbi:hypothetical protein PSECIP111951_03016 [Pseudoalteromonas holothuriae]|uniref:Uncharacterized protein n=1 Tax=Pseudoalteromonas holothuriae TaxID=2963714 RepID=A0ABM9GLC7_9GAMM|nr:hypothetical protein [Pseudoalteromonas sp. CIP111951]CAH9063979.1 hypothetical protein PSECIP111951_03016 [Pseudoalteromonas sp. CIP111951]